MSKYGLVFSFFLFAVSLVSCSSTEVQPTPTPMIPSSAPSSSRTPTSTSFSQIAYGQWDEHNMSYDYLWLAISDGSSRQVAFDWLGFTKGFNFLPDGSGMLVWTNEAPGGYSKRYILASLELNQPGPCITCLIDDLVFNPPTPSPQGEEVAILSNSGMYISNLKGTDIRLILMMDIKSMGQFSRPPSWSPDGNYIAFPLEIEGSNMNIYRIRNDGTNLMNLTEAQDGEDEFDNPQWSPVGDRIAYICGDQTVRTMNTDGLDVQIVAEIIPDTEVWSAGTYDPPQWSPDGSKLLFYSAVEPGGLADIIVVNADGSGWINLTNTPGARDWSPVWSPDGSQIAFLTDRDGNAEVYVMNADGSNLVNISQSPGTQEGAPAWRP